MRKIEGNRESKKKAKFKKHTSNSRRAKATHTHSGVPHPPRMDGLGKGGWGRWWSRGCTKAQAAQSEIRVLQLSPVSDNGGRRTTETILIVRQEVCNYPQRVTGDNLRRKLSPLLRPGHIGSFFFFFFFFFFCSSFQHLGCAIVMLMYVYRA